MQAKNIPVGQNFYLKKDVCMRTSVLCPNWGIFLYSNFLRVKVLHLRRRLIKIQDVLKGVFLKLRKQTATL